jgi:solute carrier family 25 2-oxodicarboxylate transporter 21
MTTESRILLVAGGVSGVVETLLVQPLDMIKTHQQLSKKHYSILASFRKIYKEGGLPLFYRGVAPEIFGMIPRSAAMFTTYEIVRQRLQKSLGDSWMTSSLAGACAGIPESIVITPSQVIKVRLQSKKLLNMYSGVSDCIMKTARYEGIRGFTLGLGPTLWKNCVWNTVYFGSMHYLKSCLSKPKTKLDGLYQTFVTGFLGAVLATCVNSPFDVAKSRFQAQITEIGKTPKYTSTFPTLAKICREEGFGALYKGFGPKAFRCGLGGAVAMAAFEGCVYLATNRDQRPLAVALG